MHIDVVTTPPAEVAADALIVGMWEGAGLDAAAAELDAQLGGELAAAVKLAARAELAGRRNECAILYTRGSIAAARIVVVGLGQRDQADARTLREASAAAVRFLRDRKIRRVASILHRSTPAKRAGRAELGQCAAAVVDGALVGPWEADAYRDPDGRKGGIEAFTLVEPDPRNADAVRAGFVRGSVLGDSVNFARTLANEPGNELPPMALADRARAMAAEARLACEVMDEGAMYRLGMGALLAVSVGSENRACLVVLKHMPRPGEPALALVGKGITFDTGGISIKPSENMGAMKGDMAGAASVLAAMRAIALLGLPVNVVGLAPCAENMPSGKAYRPGDVVRAMNGKTIEIVTTDAEGRLILADALTFAVRNLRAERVVDVATLTGACVIALGHVNTGAVSGDPALMAAVRAAAEAAGERVWELPHDDGYSQQIKSDIADLKNSGGRPGGAVTAGVFLKEFVDATPWLHLDIAGTATTEGAAHIAKGPTGAMVRTFVQLAEQLATGRGPTQTEP